MTSRMLTAAVIGLVVGMSGCAHPGSGAAQPPAASAADTVEPWFMGHWRVVDARFAKISAMDGKQTAGWFGRTARYEPQQMQFHQIQCDAPTYRRGVWSRVAFQQAFTIAPEALGIHQDEIEWVEIECPGQGPQPGTHLIKRDNLKLYTLWDGVFFLLQPAAD